MAMLRRLRRGDAQIAFRYDVNGRLIRIVDSLRWSISADRTQTDGFAALSLEDDGPHRSGGRTLLRVPIRSCGKLDPGLDLYNTTFGFEVGHPNRMTRRTDRRAIHSISSTTMRAAASTRVATMACSRFSRLRARATENHVCAPGDGGQWTYCYDDGKARSRRSPIPTGVPRRFTVDETGRVTRGNRPNGNVTRLLYDGRVDITPAGPLGYMLPPSAEDPKPPDPLAYELPETPIEWEHGRLLSGRKSAGPAAGDPILRMTSLRRCSSTFLPRPDNLLRPGEPRGSGPQPPEDRAHRGG